MFCPTKNKTTETITNAPPPALVLFQQRATDRPTDRPPCKCDRQNAELTGAASHTAPSGNAGQAKAPKHPPLSCRGTGATFTIVSKRSSLESGRLQKRRATNTGRYDTRILTKSRNQGRTVSRHRRETNKSVRDERQHRYTKTHLASPRQVS